MQATIAYRVASAVPASHRFQVTLTLDSPDPQGQRLWLPDWIPGSYMIRDFARNLDRLQAIDGRMQPVAITALDKSSWRCAPCTGPLTVRYEVYAWDLSVRAAHLDQHHGYFNGTSLFLAVDGREQEPVEVVLTRPDGTTGWRVATTLPALDVDADGFGRYTAPDHDTLIDHPVEMGTFDRVCFEACGVPHEIAVTGRHRGDLDRLARDLQRICEAQIRFFGEPAPFARYLFQLTVVGQGYGGLEHRDSTSLLASRDDLPGRHEPVANPGERYRGLLGLCSHEYFHSWNVKRLKPHAFLRYDLRREVHTPLLWFFEGVTSYYDDLFLVRTGLISPASYLETLARQITRHLRTPGRFHQTVSQSSFDAWTRYYKSDENTPNSSVSYYIKGSLVALCLDLLLRQRGDSLDRVMQTLWARHGSERPGVDEPEIRAALPEDAEVQAFLTRALHGTEELPWQALLADFGVEALLRAAEGGQDAGGRAAARPQPAPWLGARVQGGDGGVQVMQVFPGSPAEQGGLSAGDVIIALDGLRVTAASWERQLQARAAGEVISVYAFRRDEWMATTCVLAQAPLDTCVLNCPTAPEALSRLNSWLMPA